MDDFVALVAAALATMTTHTAMSALKNNDVAAAEIVVSENVPKHPQVVHNGSVLERVDPQFGRMQVPRHATQFAATPVIGPGDVPLLGQHTDEVLAEFGLSTREIGALRATGVVA